MKKFIPLILLSLLFSSNLNAQQDAQYTQYMYNPLSINPAYTGTRNAFSIVALYRTQWQGVDGAPKTQTLAGHLPVGRKRNIGLGFSVVNDQIGPSKETYFDLDFSYILKLEGTKKLSLGLKAGGVLLNLDYSILDQYQPGDPYFSDIDNKFSPNIGVGLFLYDNNYYIGLSAPNLLETKHYDENQESVAKERTHVYLLGGYIFDIGRNTKLKPTVLAKYVAGAPLGLDVSANMLFNDKFTVGAGYRWDASINAMVGIQVKPYLLIGYAYDYLTQDITNYSSGSHEVILRYELRTNSERVLIQSPRFF